MGVLARRTDRLLARITPLRRDNASSAIGMLSGACAGKGNDPRSCVGPTRAYVRHIVFVH
jgi:hypothetical protein